MATAAEFAGSTVVRGPLASDHYTKIHNSLWFGDVIPPQYVAVFGAIASLPPGWKTTEVALAKSMGVGREYVRSAFKALEAAGLLLRGRQRDSKGKLGGSVWFVTDIALTMRDLGVTDGALIWQAIVTKYAEACPGMPLPDTAPAWAIPDPQNPSSGPESGFPTVAGPAQTPSLPSSDPMSGNPTLAGPGETPYLPRSEPKSGYPTLASPTHIKKEPTKTESKDGEHPAPRAVGLSRSVTRANGAAAPGPEDAPKPKPAVPQQRDPGVALVVAAIRSRLPGVAYGRMAEVVTAELALGTRSPQELAARVYRRWQHYDGQVIENPYAVATALVKRDSNRDQVCPRPECEDGWLLRGDGTTAECAEPPHLHRALWHRRTPRTQEIEL